MLTYLWSGLSTSLNAFPFTALYISPLTRLLDIIP